MEEELGNIVDSLWGKSNLGGCQVGVRQLMGDLKKHDEYTYEHSVRVAQYLEEFGKSIGFTEVDCTELYVGGLLHDIGKLFISKRILTKTGKLDDWEYRKIKEHPDIGYEFLKGMGQFSWKVLDMVMMHHERIDGSGYPLGKRKHDLKAYARMLGIADSYDAMTSQRSYRGAMTKEQAIKELIRCKGTLYDGELVDEFIKMVRGN